MSVSKSGSPKKKRKSIITESSLDSYREEIRKYNDYFDEVINEHTPKTITKVEKAMVDPLSPCEVRTGSITKYGHRQLDDWTDFGKTR